MNVPTTDRDLGQTPTTRRAVVRTGAKLAYAAPLVAVTLSLSHGNADASLLSVAGGDEEEYVVCGDIAFCELDDDGGISSEGLLCRVGESAYACCHDDDDGGDDDDEGIGGTGCCIPGEDCPGDPRGPRGHCDVVACA